MILRRVFGATVLAIGIIALLTGCARGEAVAASRQTPASNDALAVTRGSFQSRILLTGELKAEDAVQLIAPNANIFPLEVRWVAEDGIEVSQGDLVVEFDASQLAANLDDMFIRALEAESELESERARVAAEINEAEVELERQRAENAKARLDAEVPAELRSGREHQMSQLNLKRAELELEGIERRLKNARESGTNDIELRNIEVRKAYNEVERAEASIGKLTLKAPRDGILILGENFREGRPLRPGDTVFPGMLAAQLPDLATLGVEGRLFDVDDERVAAGQLVTARLDAFPDRAYTGRVVEVEEIADQADGRSLRRFFTVRITLDQVDPELMRPGMSVKVVIEDEPEDGVLLVPRACLDFDGDTPRAVLTGGRRVDVELGPCDAFHCRLESGLEEGQKLARAREVSP